MLGLGQASLQPLERGAFGDTLGLEIRTPTFHLNFFIFFSPPHPTPHLGTWVCLAALGADSQG